MIELLTKFWEGLGDRLGQQFATRLLSPALVFWIGGFIAWVLSHHDWRKELDTQSQFLKGSSVVLQIVAVVLLVLGMIGSSIVMERVGPYARNLLEGNWPMRPRFVHRLRNKARKRLQERVRAWRDLYDVSVHRLYDMQEAMEHDTPSGMEAQDIVSSLHLKLQKFPDEFDQFMPTRLGNILRAADARPSRKYGLDATVCWPVLWLLLTQEERTDVAKARASLDFQAVAWCWSLLFLVWTPWAWWAVPAGLVACIGVYYGAMLSTAQLYGQLLEASFDAYRDKLYKALRVPLPKSTAQERVMNRRLTWLLLGDSSTDVRYVDSSYDVAVKVIDVTEDDG